MVSTRHHADPPVQEEETLDAVAQPAKQHSSGHTASASDHSHAANQEQPSTKHHNSRHRPEAAANGTAHHSVKQEPTDGILVQEQQQQHHANSAAANGNSSRPPRPRRSTAAAAAAVGPAAAEDSDADAAFAADSSDSGGDSSSDDDDFLVAGRRASRAGAAAAAGGAATVDAPSPAEGDRAARAGRTLRAQVKKPTQISTFTKEPPRPQLSRKDREKQQRQQERTQRQQQQELEQLRRREQQQQKQREAAVRAAESGRLTRHVVKMLPDVIEASASPVSVAAAVGADSPAAAGMSAVAANIGVPDDVGAPDSTAAAGNAATAPVRKPKRGLKGEVLRLQQQLEQLQQLQEQKAEREAAKRANRQAAQQQQQQQQWHSLRDRQQLVDYREDSGADDDDGQGLSDGELGDRQGLGRSRYPTRGQKRAREQQDQDVADDDADADGSESDDEDDDDEDERPPSRKKYQLRSRENYGVIERFTPGNGNVAAAAAAPTGIRRTSNAGRGSGERRRDRAYTRTGGGHRRSRGGFSERDSSDDDDLLRKLRSDSHWNAFLAAQQGAPGPYYTPAMPNLNTPAAAVAAAAAAAANGFLSPNRAAADRRSNFHISDGGGDLQGQGLAPGPSGLAPAGSGWGHWGGGQGSGGHEGAAGFRDAAATAGGREGRGGLGQELITPLQVDPSIGFDQVGGLDQYLSALKEMIFLPLLYPELFEKFGVNPPRGVLFHGPPGTGKTLVARALAAQASRAAGQKVSFYMRKGADLLSKWVGEAEKQLRLLFEEAQRNQPAIIFFDEIDGLAPVRTSKQDQVHNSIVSTLLALMDGLESRGRVVLIGATNRPDALDPALRRPGRFDRELLFPLPDLSARRAILGIHSRAWQPQPDSALLDELAGLTGGYCGADIKALCAEASLAALRRVYPQIYESETKLLINPAAVVVTRQDFKTAMQGLTPAAHRATASHARALDPIVAPCLTKHLQAALAQLKTLFPPAAAALAAAAAGSDKSLPRHSTALVSSSAHGSSYGSNRGLINGSSSSSELFCMARPRLLIAGAAGAGQQQVAAAVLAALEGLPVYPMGLPSLLGSAGSRCVEESLISAFTEARRAAPAIIYWPQAHLWWAAAGSGLRCALIALLDDLPQDLPLLLLATAELPTCPSAAATAGVGTGQGSSSSSSAVAVRQQQQQDLLQQLGLDPSLAVLFPAVGNVGELQQPQQQQQPGISTGDLDSSSSILGWLLLGQIGSSDRKAMFQGVFDAAAAPPAPAAVAAAQQPPAPLPPAPDAQAAAAAAKKAAAAAAARAAYEDDQAVLRSLRIVLRTIVTRALSQKRYRLFAEPPLPDDEGGVEALQALTQPMDLLTMLYKVDHQQYLTPAAFLADAHLIVQCAEELYGDPAAAAVIPAAAAEVAAPAEDADPAAAPAGSSAFAAAAAAAGGDQAAAAAAARGGSSVPVLTKSLPAVKVAVSKEISRAMELKDDLETQVYQLLSPDLVRCCEAIAAKGGPAPPPPGMVLPQQLLPPLPPTGRPAAASADGAKSTRATARSSGRHMDKRMMHADPEALMRALKQPRKSAAAAARATPSGAETPVVPAEPETEQQQQQGKRESSVPIGDAEMADAEQPAAAAAAAAALESDPTGGAAAALFGPAAAAAVVAGNIQQQQQQQQQESPAALRPVVTNGQSRKRPAADAADGDRPAKHPAVSNGNAAADHMGQQQQQGVVLQAHEGHTHAAGAEVDAASPVVPAAPAAAAAAPKPQDVATAETLLQRLVAATVGVQLSELEMLYARLSRVVAANENELDRQVVLQRVEHVVIAVEQDAAAGATDFDT